MSHDITFREEILFTYRLIGDVFRDNFDKRFDSIFPYLLGRIHGGWNRVNNLLDEFDYWFNLVTETAEDTGKKMTKEDWREYIKKILTGEPTLFVVAETHSSSEKDLLDNFRRLIRDNKERDVFKKFENDFDSYQFQYPSAQGNLDELRRYLKVYDLKNSRKTNREISSLVYNKELNSDVKRIVLRDFDKAKRIISNAEIGYFPGQY